MLGFKKKEEFKLSLDVIVQQFSKVEKELTDFIETKEDENDVLDETISVLKKEFSDNIKEAARAKSVLGKIQDLIK